MKQAEFVLVDAERAALPGKEIRIDQAPTRGGRVSFRLMAKPGAKSIVAHADLSGASAPKEVHFKLRLPLQSVFQSVTVNGQPASLGGIHNDTVIIAAKNERRFEGVGQLS